MKRILYIFFLVLISCSTTKIEVKKENVKDIINYNWWLSFKDDNLTLLIEKVIENNKDIKIAISKLNEYNQVVSIYFGAELPTLNTSLYGYHNNKLYGINNQLFSATFVKQNGLTLPVLFNYELDYLGKNRNKTQSAEKQLESYKYQIQSMYLSLVSNVSSLYFNIAKINKLIVFYNDLISLKQDILNTLYEKQVNNLVSDIEINNVLGEINTLKINIDNLSKVKHTFLTQLAVLVGDNPSKVFIEVSNIDDIQKDEINKNISSDVIFTRPDVIACEKLVEKAQIDIKIARKEFFPTINLSAGAIFSNMTGGGLFNPNNTIYSLLGGLSMDLFTGGRKRANLRMNYAKYETILEEYKKVSLIATKEVIDSLNAIDFDDTIINKNNEKYNFEKNNFDKLQIMFNNGLLSSSDLKKAKQKLILLQMDQVNMKVQKYIDYINLYKATAGNFIN